MRRVPLQFSIGGDKDNAQKAWLDGYDTAMREMREVLKQANALTLMLQEGDDGIHHPDRDFSHRTLHQLKGVLHAALTQTP